MRLTREDTERANVAEAEPPLRAKPCVKSSDSTGNCVSCPTEGARSPSRISTGNEANSERYVLVYYSPAVTTWTSINSYISIWIFKTIYIHVRKLYILYSYLFFVYIIWALIWKYWQSSLQIYTERFIWQATNIMFFFFFKKNCLITWGIKRI